MDLLPASVIVVAIAAVAPLVCIVVLYYACGSMLAALHHWRAGRRITALFTSVAFILACAGASMSLSAPLSGLLGLFSWKFAGALLIAGALFWLRTIERRTRSAAA